MAGSDRAIAEVFARQRGRLQAFIRRRVADIDDAEDILQEVFYELVEAARLMRPVEQVGAWLLRVARNRIIDLFRKKKTTQIDSLDIVEYEERLEEAFTSVADLLPAIDGGPEAAYARRLLIEELDAALDELPDEQRSVFIAHEIEGRSFKDLALQTGVGVNTLLSRKRYAVQHLRRRLQAIYEEFVER